MCHDILLLCYKHFPELPADNDKSIAKRHFILPCPRECAFHRAETWSTNNSEDNKCTLREKKTTFLADGSFGCRLCEVEEHVFHPWVIGKMFDYDQIRHGHCLSLGAIPFYSALSLDLESQRNWYTEMLTWEFIEGKGFNGMSTYERMRLWARRQIEHFVAVGTCKGLKKGDPKLETAINSAWNNPKRSWKRLLYVAKMMDFLKDTEAKNMDCPWVQYMLSEVLHAVDNGDDDEHRKKYTAQIPQEVLDTNEELKTRFPARFPKGSMPEYCKVLLPLIFEGLETIEEDTIAI